MFAKLKKMLQAVRCRYNLHDIFYVEYKDGEIAAFCYNCDWDGEGAGGRRGDPHLDKFFDSPS